MTFSVASYNVLADSYINPSWYPGTPAAVLESRQRRPALVQRVAGLGADIACLQEVEADVFEAMKDRLGPMAYNGVLAPKGGGKPDGCATFVKKTSFTVVRVQTLHYADGGGTKPDSGHLALITILEREGRRVGIANTHLKWDSPGTPVAEQWGYRQITQLLKEQRALAQECRSWIICGDLNVTADSPVVLALTQAGFLDAYRGREHLNTCNPHGKAKRIDFLFHTADLDARAADLPLIDDRTPLPSASEPSDHLAIMAGFDWSAT